MSKDNNIKYPQLNDKYKLIVKLGSGSFGEVYKAQNRETKKTYAVKIEPKTTKSRLAEEYKIYKKLEKNGVANGIPKIFDFFETSKDKFLIMQYLGKDLDELQKNNKGKFDLGTIFKLGVDIIELLQNIHSAGFVHRDIKPNNFLIDHSNPSELYIMDFGLSKQYMVNDSHINMRVERDLVGTARYASINVHLGFEPSRRDDLESVGYMLIYFLLGKLPWQGLKEKKGQSKIKIIGEVKQYTSLRKLCEHVPKMFIEYLTYCKKLGFETKPDYDYLKKLFIDESKKRKIRPEYCWIKK